MSLTRRINHARVMIKAFHSGMSSAHVRHIVLSLLSHWWITVEWNHGNGGFWATKTWVQNHASLIFTLMKLYIYKKINWQQFYFIIRTYTNNSGMLGIGTIHIFTKQSPIFKLRFWRPLRVNRSFLNAKYTNARNDAVKTVSWRFLRLLVNVFRWNWTYKMKILPPVFSWYVARDIYCFLLRKIIRAHANE